MGGFLALTLIPKMRSRFSFAFKEVDKPIVQKRNKKGDMGSPLQRVQRNVKHPVQTIRSVKVGLRQYKVLYGCMAVYFYTYY